jgi:hypothetical protein
MIKMEMTKKAAELNILVDHEGFNGLAEKWTEMETMLDCLNHGIPYEENENGITCPALEDMAKENTKLRKFILENVRDAMGDKTWEWFKQYETEAFKELKLEDK